MKNIKFLNEGVEGVDLWNQKYSDWKGMRYEELKKKIDTKFDEDRKASKGDDKKVKDLLDNVKKINYEFATETGFNLYDLPNQEEAVLVKKQNIILDSSISPTINKDKLTTDETKADKGTGDYLTIISTFYKLLEDKKVIIRQGAVTDSTKPAYLEIPYLDKKKKENRLTFEINGTYTQYADNNFNNMTVENLVALADYFYTNEEIKKGYALSKPKPAPSIKPDAPSGGGGAVVPVPKPAPTFYDLKSPSGQADATTQELSNLILDFYKIEGIKFPDIKIKTSKGEIITLNKDQVQASLRGGYGPRAHFFTIVSLDQIIIYLNQLIKAVEEPSATQKESRLKRLENLSQLLNAKFTKSKSNWLFEETPTAAPPQPDSTAPAAAPAPATLTATAVSVPTRTIVINAYSTSPIEKTIEIKDENDKRRIVDSLKAKLEKVTQVRDKLIKAYGFNKEGDNPVPNKATPVQITDVKEAVGVLKDHKNDGWGLNKTVSIPQSGAPAGKEGGKEAPPPAPPIPPTREANCWFAFDTTAYGVPNTSPTMIWARTDMNFDNWQKYAQTVINDRNTHESYTYLTGARSVHKAQVELLINRKDLSINLGCFETIFRQVYNALLSSLRQAKAVYANYTTNEEKTAFQEKVKLFINNQGKFDKEGTPDKDLAAVMMFVGLRDALAAAREIADELIQKATEAKKSTGDKQVFKAAMALLGIDEKAQVTPPAGGTPAAPAADAAKTAAADAAKTAADAAKTAAADAAKTAAADAAKTAAGGTAADAAKTAAADAAKTAAADAAKTAAGGTAADAAKTAAADAAKTAADAAKTAAGAVKPDPKAEEVVNKAEEAARAAAQKQEKAAKRAAEIDAAKKKAEAERNAQKAAALAAAKKALDEEIAKAIQEAAAALKQAQEIIIRTHKITNEELRNEKIKALLGDLADKGKAPTSQYTEILKVLNDLRTVKVVLPTKERAAEDAKQAEKAQAAADSAAKKGKEDADKKTEQDRIVALQTTKIEDLNKLSNQDIGKLNFDNYFKLANAQSNLNDEFIKQLLAKNQNFPLPGTLVEREAIAAVQTALKNFIKSNPNLKPTYPLLFYTVDRRTDSSNTTESNNPYYLIYDVRGDFDNTNPVLDSNGKKMIDVEFGKQIKPAGIIPRFTIQDVQKLQESTKKTPFEDRHKLIYESLLKKFKIK